jgi:hypothetical protein
MKAPILLCVLMFTACAATPRSNLPDAKASAAHASFVAPDPFPVPKEGLAIAGDASGGPTLDKVLADFERVTGVHFVVGPETANLLSMTHVGVTRPLDVPAAEVWSVVETLVTQHDFLFSLLRREDPRLIGVESMEGPARKTARSAAIQIEAADIPVWQRHPAFLVQTVLDLDQLDVRTISNSMRSMFTDANTQQIIPVGNTNSMMILGSGPTVASLAATFRAMNETERRSAATREKPAAPAKEPK